MTRLPEQVAATTALHLESLDAVAPGLVTGLYLTGSVALGDFHPHTSDIDGVVVTSSRVHGAELVRDVHARLPAKPAYDVCYVTAADLATPPRRDRPVAFTRDGEFKQLPNGGPVTPVLWAELARHAIPVREQPGLTVYDDDAALRDYTRDNLTSYWEPHLDTVAAYVKDRVAEEPIDAWIVGWTVLGVPRLHALLTTGAIVSKTAAGRHGADRFAQWAELCDRCLADRAGEPQRYTVEDARAAVAFGRAVIADAVRAG
jgi:Nucleotidyltransferase domain